jgi:hypothetical protein
MRLNAQMKSAILSKACSKLEKKVVEARKKYQTLAEKDALANIGTMEERDIMNKAPNSWFQMRSVFRSGLSNYRYEVLYTEPKRTEYQTETPTINTFTHRVPYDMGPFTPSKSTTKAWYDLIEAIELFHKTRFELYNRINQFGSLERLKSAWPACEEYSKDVVIPTTKALIVRFDDIQSRL